MDAVGVFHVPGHLLSLDGDVPRARPAGLGLGRCPASRSQAAHFKYWAAACAFGHPVVCLFLQWTTSFIAWRSGVPFTVLNSRCMAASPRMPGPHPPRAPPDPEELDEPPEDDDDDDFPPPLGMTVCRL